MEFQIYDNSSNEEYIQEYSLDTKQLEGNKYMFISSDRKIYEWVIVEECVFEYFEV